MKRALTRWSPQEAAAAIKRSKRVYKGEVFDLRTIPQTQNVARLLVVTPKKSGNAAQRNRFRRRVKALFYEKKLHEGKLDWIIFAKQGISDASFSDLEKKLGELVLSLPVNS